MSKPATQWPLRFKSPAELPSVAKFSDAIDWEQANLPVSMYFAQEDLKEDEIVSQHRDSEYYRRKREKRRSYRSKNTLVLEDSSGSSTDVKTGFRFEGKLCNLGLADSEEIKAKSSISALSKTEAPFRYVLLQFVKRELETAEGSAPSTVNEVNVIPVGDIFSFKKAAKVPDELLADIDERFLEEMQRSKGNISRYRGISKSLTNAERARLGLSTAEDGEDEELGGQGRGRKSGQGLNAKEFLGGFGSSALFGAAVNKSLGGKWGRGAGSTGSTLSSGSFLNENGVDEDELRADRDNAASGEYTRFVDDEEEYVHIEQRQNQMMAESELSAAQRYSADAEEEGGDSSGDSSEEEEGEAGERGRRGLLDDGERGMVDESMITGAAQARKLFVSRPSAAVGNRSDAGATAAVSVSDAVKAAPAAGTQSGHVRSALKRRREDSAPAVPTEVAEREGAAVGGSGGSKALSVTFSAVPAVDGSAGPAVATEAPPAAAARPGVAPASQASQAQGEEPYPLTEQGFRRFMSHRGGKVLPADMNYFKPQLKACDKAAKQRFFDIVLNLTVEVEDPLLGKVMTLK